MAEDFFWGMKMSDGFGKKLSVLAEAQSLDDDDIVYVVRGGKSWRMTAAKLREAMQMGVKFLDQADAADAFTALADDDLLLGVDVSDTTDSAEGTTKRLEAARVFELTSAAAPLHAWEPPRQPSALASDPDAFADAENWSADDFIRELWEPLRAANPGYISGDVLGKDQSGTYDVHRYVFEPPCYDRTIILSCSMHGNEVTNQLALYRILHHMIHDWRDHPQLAHLRWRVRLVVLPIVNPWGISQETRSRTNSRNVDINRNFDYRWAGYTQTAPYNGKGDAPFSEAESQYVRDTLTEFSDADTYLDLHDYPGGTDTDYPIFIPAEFGDGSGIVADVISWLHADDETSSVITTYNPTGFMFAAAAHGMNGANPEFSAARYGEPFSSECLTRAVRWYGNLLIAYARSPSKARNVQQTGGRCWFARFNTGSQGAEAITTSSSAYEEVEDLRIELDIPQSGYIKVSGVANVSATEAAQVYVTPLVGQGNYGTFGADDPYAWPTVGADKDAYFEAYAAVTSPSDRAPIPFIAVIPVRRSSSIEFMPGKVRVGLRWRVTAGTATLWRYRALIEFIPSPLGDDRVQVYDATEHSGTGVGAMQKKFPVNNSWE